MLDEKKLKSYIDNNKSELFSILEQLCKIPAPSGNENKRAEFCRNWLTKIGFENITIDDVNNVICPINCSESNEITIIAAHLDTVFQTNIPLNYHEKDGKIFCPGVGDNTACVSVLLMTAKYLYTSGFNPKKGLIILFNSCEEGLGNLKGTRKIMQTYKGRVKQFISLDGTYDTIYNECVGSHRYEVCIKTEGGHSFQMFGNKNAIAELSKIVNKIYEIDVPKEENIRTTYNVGIISGGTSVNTIAQSAKLLCEYRSDSLKHLSYMENKFKYIFEHAKKDDVFVEYTLIGERPCANNVDSKKVNELSLKGKKIIDTVADIQATFDSASTDCNIPMSLGIPSVCIGAYLGEGEHTTEEWISKESLPVGLEIAIKIIYDLF